MEQSNEQNSGLILSDSIGLWRKKPVVIRAIQWDGTYKSLLYIETCFPKLESAGKSYHEKSNKVYNWNIRTLEGSHIVTPGDFIIEGVKEEYYPCKPEIFNMTYERA